MNKPERILGVVMDPIEAIKPHKDSTLAMLLAAQNRGYRLAYFLQNGLSVRDGVPYAAGHIITVADDPSAWFSLDEPWQGQLDKLDVLFMRKDPPFNMEYIYATYILELAEARGLLVVNKPSSLRDMNEKFYTARFPECCPPTLVTRSHEQLHAFLSEHGQIVVKPLDGMGGQSIFIISHGDANTNVVFETLTQDSTRFAMAQRYIAEISDGDKRILLIDGEPIDYALARIPAPGESRGNLAVGARGEGRSLTERDQWIAAQVGPVLAENGIVFAGLDVIGNFLTEINVTSPTGIRELDRSFGIDIAAKLMGAVERRWSDVSHRK